MLPFREKLVHKIIARTATLFLLQLMMLSSAHAAPPLAGSTVDNQAKIEYCDSNAGFFSTVFSNTVKSIVQPVENVLVQFPQTIYR